METDYNESDYGPIAKRFQSAFKDDFVVLKGGYTNTIYIKTEWFSAYLFCHKIYLSGNQICFEELNSSALRFIFRNIDKFYEDEWGDYAIHYEDFLSLLETQKIV